MQGMPLLVSNHQLHLWHCFRFGSWGRLVAPRLLCELFVGLELLKAGLEGLKLLNSWAKLKTTAFYISCCKGRCNISATASRVLELLRDCM